jgi:hypothetical protein
MSVKFLINLFLNPAEGGEGIIKGRMIFQNTINNPQHVTHYPARRKTYFYKQLICV